MVMNVYNLTIYDIKIFKLNTFSNNIILHCMFVIQADEWYKYESKYSNIILLDSLLIYSN